jgi:hypothetical protein
VSHERGAVGRSASGQQRAELLQALEDQHQEKNNDNKADQEDNANSSA